MVKDYSRTPSLTNSEETIASGSELPLTKPASHLPPVHHLPSPKGKERAAPRISLPTVLYNLTPHSSHSHGRLHRFVSTWSHPAILQHLLSFLCWRDFHAVTRACRDLRDLFHDPCLKTVTLSRFVPGYRSEGRDGAEEEIDVSLTDLEALMLSQSLPLHRYPMHAVYIVSAVNGISPHAQTFTQRLIRLAQAHSLFALILRSRAPRWEVSFDSDDSFVRQTSSLGLRELTFPAPLSYFDPAMQKPPPLPPPPSSGLKKRSKSKRRAMSEEDPSSPSRPTSSGSRKRRLSIFGGTRERVPLPAPHSSPPSIRYYSSVGRAYRMATHSMTDDESGPTFSRHSRFMTDTLPPPRYPFASRNSSSPNSSVGSLSRSASSPVQSSLSPHDLSNALLRTRAPILRVFVPCSTLTSPEVIAAVEGQLFVSGLWKHLRNGDIICNLGYVPEDSSSARGWLVFTGDALWPFFPPAPPPVPELTALPSPLYYSHLLPSFENLRCILRVPRGVRMVLNLALLSSNVPSPHSHAGYARVKRYTWLGRLFIREEDTVRLGLGEGWAGEWILEAEGTKEGRQMLLDAIEKNEHSSMEKEWELVREKSSAGKVWLRLVSEQHGLDDLSAELSTPVTAR